MPLKGGSRKRSRGSTEQASGNRLKGWQFIQEKVLSHDEDMISDYADDIDTLLVFAGLFSAVLTAFLVVSLVLLQPDNSQITVQLLSLIALQNGAPAGMQSYLNETAESLPTSATFKPPANATTINTLWFASLILSLAAALFGILAKQWCREYLRWHSVIASARENVLIRQVRFEAWERWQVASFIATIPAFLEIALALFLVGLLVFVPTFYAHSMTVVVFVLIGSVLLGVVVLTILPVFYRLCPFQTPTGWAFVRLASPLSKPFWCLVFFSVFIPPYLLLLVVTLGGAENWQWLDDLGSYIEERMFRTEKLKNWRLYGLHSVQDSTRCISTVPGIRETRHGHQLEEAAIDAVQTSVLARVLSWVRLGSNDNTVLSAIYESLPSIHASIAGSDVDGEPFVLSAIYATCAVNISQVCTTMESFFYERRANRFSFRTGPLSSFRLDDVLGPFIYASPHRFSEHYQAMCEAWTSNSAALEVRHALARFEMSALIDDWLLLLIDTRDEASKRRQMVAEKITLLLCTLRMLPSEATYRAAREAGTALTRPLVETLEEMYRKLAPHKVAYEDGLISMCVEMLRLLGPVNVVREHGGIYDMTVDTDSLYNLGKHEYPWDSTCNLVSTWATYAMDIYRNTDNYADANGRHLFVASVSRVFETVRLRIDYHRPVMDKTETISLMVELLSRMVDALRWSLVHSHPDCGTYTSFSWVKDILQCYQAAEMRRRWIHVPNRISWNWVRSSRRPGRASRDSLDWDTIPLTGNSTLRPTFLIVLRLLQTCLERKLLTNETSTEDFEELLKVLDMKVEELPDLPADLTLQALEIQQLARQERSERTTDDFPDDILPEWMWALRNTTTTPALSSEAQLATSLENATCENANTTICSSANDVSDRAAAAARDDPAHTVEECEGAAWSHDNVPSTRTIAPGSGRQSRQAAVITSASSGKAARSLASNATPHVAQSSPARDIDGSEHRHLNNIASRPVPVRVPTAVGDSRCVLPRSTEAHAAKREAERGSVQTSTSQSQDVSSGDTIVALPVLHLGTGHGPSMSPSTSLSTPLPTNAKSAQRADDPGTHPPSPITNMPLSQPADRTSIEPAPPATEASQVSTNAFTPSCLQKLDDADGPLPPCVHLPPCDLNFIPLTSSHPLEIDNTERDLESGPFIPSPVSAGPPEV